MKISCILFGLAVMVMAKPQQPPPSPPTEPAPPPPTSPVPPPNEPVPPVPPPVPPVPPAEPPVPPPSDPSPTPPQSPVPDPPTSPPPSAPSPPSLEGPICECGYTYCAEVLMSMGKPWSEQQLSEAYCKTPQATCPGGAPPSNVTSALFICLCDGTNQAIGNHLELLCGCDKCLNIGPDFRGRCQTPCSVGECATGGGAGNNPVGRGGSGGGGRDGSDSGKGNAGSHRYWW